MENPLMQVPGLAGYLGAQQQNQQNTMQQIQQAANLQTLQAHFDQQEQQGALRKALSESGGDVDKALEIALKTGNVSAAHQLAPLVKLANEKKAREETTAAVRSINATVAPQPDAQPKTVAPDFPTADPADASFQVQPPAPAGAPSAQQRIANLTKLSEAYAQHPAVVQRINNEIDRLQKSADRAPTQRNRVSGENMVQEEFRDGQWQEVGRGPRFARQIAQAGGGYAQQGALHPVNDREAIRDIAVQSLYDPNATVGYRRDTQTMGHIQREKIKVMKEAGITSEDVVSGRAGFKADTMSLNKITPQYDAITAFEKTAIRNGKVLKDLADKVDTTGTPVVERWIRAGRKAVGGDPDVAQFDAQLNVYRNEAAKILTNPNLTGVLTVDARREMEHVIKGDASATQIRAVVDLLERDFENRKQTMEEQIGTIRARMRSRVSPGNDKESPPAAPPAAAPRKPVSQMTNAELMAYRRQLTGGQ